MDLTNNIIVKTFIQGGPIMWPILITAIIATAVVIERTLWWIRERARQRPNQLESVLEKIENGEVETASKIARDSSDARLRVIYHGLNHYHSSLPGALQMAAGVEVERAERFIGVLDTIVTLAPLLGLLGTVTGIMHSFNFVGSEELAATKVSGGIAEALIATAAGLSIAILCLIPLNYFSRRLEKLRFELETIGTNIELMVEKARALV